MLAVVTAYTLVLTGSVAAQQSLQNTAPQTGLQPQGGAPQTQEARNTQNDVRSLQNNQGQDVLSQGGSFPLGVVSDPNQLRPDAVVQPSPTLKTEVAQEADPDSTSVFGLVIGSLVVVLGLFAAIRYIMRANNTPFGTPQDDELLTGVARDHGQQSDQLSTSSFQRNKIKKTSKKKRKKPHQR